MWRSPGAYKPTAGFVLRLSSIPIRACSAQLGIGRCGSPCVHHVIGLTKHHVAYRAGQHAIRPARQHAIRPARQHAIYHTRYPVIALHDSR